jgi:hypothetical protein
MRVEGSFRFETTDAVAVWEALTAPRSITACLPGCEGLEELGDGEYRISMRIGIGPIRGPYTGTVRIEEAVAPSTYTMRLDATGSGGFANGRGEVRLGHAGGGIEVRYEGDVAIGGRIAAVGPRMVGGAARMIIERFFKCAAARLAESAAIP